MAFHHFKDWTNFISCLIRKKPQPSLFLLLFIDNLKIFESICALFQWIICLLASSNVIATFFTHFSLKWIYWCVLPDISMFIWWLKEEKHTTSNHGEDCHKVVKDYKTEWAEQNSCYQISKDLRSHIEGPKIAKEKTFCPLCCTIWNVFSLGNPEKSWSKPTRYCSYDINKNYKPCAVVPSIRFRSMFESWWYLSHNPYQICNSRSYHAWFRSNPYY